MKNLLSRQAVTSSGAGWHTWVSSAQFHALPPSLFKNLPCYKTWIFDIEILLYIWFVIAGKAQMELIVLTMVLLHNPRYLFYFSVQVLPELLEKSYFSRLGKVTWRPSQIHLDKGVDTGCGVVIVWRWWLNVNMESLGNKKWSKSHIVGRPASQLGKWDHPRSKGIQYLAEKSIF